MSKLGNTRSGNIARMEIAVYPLGSGNPSVSKEVSRVFDVLEHSGLSFEITVMGTIVEGTPDELFSLARRLHDIMFSDTVRRVITTIKIDERR